jgi:hypothetical protein
LDPVASASLAAHEVSGDAHAVVLALKATVASVTQEAAERVAAVQAEADARIVALAGVGADLDGVRLAVGTTLGVATLDGAGDAQVTVSTVWGIDSAGDPYFDAAGAAVGQEAALIITDDGSLAVAGIGA